MHIFPGYELPPYRPPSEACSVLFRATRGCPWNKCAFCDMYKGIKYEVRELAELLRDISTAREIYSNSDVRTVFIGDSNPLALKHEHFLRVLEALYTTFPELERVTSYARAKTIKRKSMGELRELREAGLTRLHIGLETGDDKLLKYINKGASAEDMCIAGSKVMDAGMELTEYVILGLGGRERWAEHAVATARVLNIINPHWIRVRTLILRPNAPLYKWAQRGEFVPSTAEEVLQETRMLIDNLNVTSEFLSDHVSNYLPVNGRLPEDQGKMLEFIDMTLETLRLVPDAKTRILQPEWLRRL